MQPADRAAELPDPLEDVTPSGTYPDHSAEPNVVDIYLATQSFAVPNRRAERRGKIYNWYALAVTSDGREALGRDIYKNLAMAEALGELIKEGKGQTTYRLLPHDRIHHRLGTACVCELCLLLDASPEYAHVEVVPGSLDTLTEWETIATRCAAKVVETGHATTTTTCHGIPIPCTEIRDNGGVVTSRMLPERIPAEMVICSDASQSISRTARSVAAAAAVGTDGRYVISGVDTKRAGVPAIDFAELTGIHLALRNWAGQARHLIIRCDSREALRMVEACRTGRDMGSTGRALGTATRIAEFIETYESLGGQVTLEWVKGHSGDPLNDGADRLAIHARRALEWGTFDDAVTTRQCRQIVDDTIDTYRREQARKTDQDGQDSASEREMESVPAA